MDQHTDSDFLALKDEVVNGFTTNSEQHQALCDMAKENARRQEKLDSILAEVTLFNKHIGKQCYGNGAVGIFETVRNHGDFISGSKRLVWLLVGMFATQFVGLLFLIFKHTLDTP